MITITLFLIGFIEVRLSETASFGNLKRVEVRQYRGKWGSICCRAFCGTDMHNPLKEVTATMADLCGFLGFQHFLAFRNDVEDSQHVSIPVHLEIAFYVDSIYNLVSMSEFGIRNWTEATCDATSNIYLSCISCKY